VARMSGSLRRGDAKKELCPSHTLDPNKVPSILNCLTEPYQKVKVGRPRTEGPRQKGKPTMNFAADQILQVAIELERRGRTFYESLSQECGNTEIKALAAALAEIEGEHIDTFQRMRETLPANLRGPDLSEDELRRTAEVLYPRILPDPETVHRVVQAADLCRALEMAIEMEGAAVAFYEELALVGPGLNSLVLSEVADEERGHLNLLQRARTLLSGGKPGRKPGGEA